MTDEIKLNYPLAEEMIRTFQQGMQELEQTKQEMHAIAAIIDSGALLGQGGVAFTDAMRSKLDPSLVKLIDKFEELAGDVNAAIDFMKAADTESRGMF